MTYTYRIRPYTGEGASKAYGPYAYVTIKPKVGKVTGLAATRNSSGALNISWGEASGAHSYELERSTDGVNFNKKYEGSTRQWTDTDALAGTVYYRVRAPKHYKPRPVRGLFGCSAG